jgi:hypothetical protein
MVGPSQPVLSTVLTWPPVMMTASVTPAGVGQNVLLADRPGRGGPGSVRYRPPLGERVYISVHEPA